MGGTDLWEMANIILKFCKTVQLKRFCMQMDDAWYMPDTKIVLQNASEEEKVFKLYYNSDSSACLSVLANLYTWYYNSHFQESVGIWITNQGEQASMFLLFLVTDLLDVYCPHLCISVSGTHATMLTNDHNYGRLSLGGWCRDYCHWWTLNAWEQIHQKL
jgi:hypothetical protein